MASAPADAASTAALVLPAPPTASTASTDALVYLPTVFVNERIRFLFCKRTVVLQATFRSSCMRKYGVILSLFWSFPFAGWGQIRTEGVVRLEADQARIEAALDAALRTKQVNANAEAWATLVYAQAERPLRAEDSTGVASVYARGYFLDRTNVKTYCLFLPRQAAFYLVRYVVGGLGIVSVRPADAVSTPPAPLTPRQTRQRNRGQAAHLRQYLLESGRLPL